MSLPKSRKELELAGTYRKDRHSHLDRKIKGESVEELKPTPGWKKRVKDQFQAVTQNLINFDMLQTQDIPSIYHLGDLLAEIDWVKLQIKAAKKDGDPMEVMQYQNQLVKLTKAFTDLAIKFYVTPAARNKAIADMANANEKKKLNKALDLITHGSL